MLPLVHRFGLYMLAKLQGMDVRVIGEHCDNL